MPCSRSFAVCIAFLYCLLGQSQIADAQGTGTVLTYAQGIAMNATFDARKDHAVPCSVHFADGGGSGDFLRFVLLTLRCDGAFGNRARFDLFANSPLGPGWTVVDTHFRTDASDHQGTYMSVNTLPTNGSGNPFASFNMTARARTSVSTDVAIVVKNPTASFGTNPFTKCLVGGDQTRWGKKVMAYKCTFNSDCNNKQICVPDPCGNGLFCVKP
jgi:hypothetical protein